MKRYFLPFFSLAFLFFSIKKADAQGMHFSQYYNAPMLLNPANTALMPENDFRIGVNYRNQWASVPVPYKTFSAFADFQALRNRNQTNWLGAGLSFWNDKAGDGDLSILRMEALLAYHIQMGEFSMISAGVGVASVQRTIDFNKLSFDRQWDGFRFDPNLPSGEGGYVSGTSFFDLSAGVNLAFFPNENTYLKFGAGLAHINQPKESFYGQENTMGFRPTGNVDLLLKLGPDVIVNPSVYFTTQKNAMELLFGSLFQFRVTRDNVEPASIIAGSFYRWDEAVVGALGIQFNKFRLMTSYDFTTSSLNTVNKSRGAFEASLVFESVYNSFSRDRRTLNCPRF